MAIKITTKNYHLLPQDGNLSKIKTLNYIKLQTHFLPQISGQRFFYFDTEKLKW